MTIYEYFFALFLTYLARNNFRNDLFEYFFIFTNNQSSHCKTIVIGVPLKAGAYDVSNYSTMITGTNKCFKIKVVNHFSTCWELTPRPLTCEAIALPLSHYDSLIQGW